MPFQRQININPGVSPDTVTFDPSPLEVKAGDQIFWTNNDSQPHWPSRISRNQDGTIAINQASFMKNQIAGGDSSATFSPGVAEAIEYVCSLHLKCVLNGLSSEAGTIEVKSMTA